MENKEDKIFNLIQWSSESLKKLEDDKKGIIKTFGAEWHADAVSYHRQSRQDMVKVAYHLIENEKIKSKS